MHTLRLPHTFWYDHYDRCEEQPGVRRVVKCLSREVVVELDDEAFKNLWSDAAYYAGGGLDMAPSGVVASARTTLSRMRVHRLSN